MFRGSNHINVDSKFRVAIPAKYRETLQQQSAGRLVANIDINGAPCIKLYPLPVWEEIEENVQRNIEGVGQAARVQRLILSRATEVDMDSSGRILVPPDLRNHINLEKKVVLAGLGKRFELWREDEWQREQQAGLEEIEDRELVQKVVAAIGYL